MSLVQLLWVCKFGDLQRGGFYKEINLALGGSVTTQLPRLVFEQQQLQNAVYIKQIYSQNTLK